MASSAIEVVFCREKCKQQKCVYTDQTALQCFAGLVKGTQQTVIKVPPRCFERKVNS